MDLPVLTRVAYDGERQVRFRASVLAAATTRDHRPHATRWTELTIYRAPISDEEPPCGIYVVARVGRSVLAHRKGCERVNTKRMTGITPENGSERWVPCQDCLPTLDPPLPGTVVERTRHQLHRARTAPDLVTLVFPDWTVDRLTGMTADTVAQLRHTDPDFDDHWCSVVAPVLTWE